MHRRRIEHGIPLHQTARPDDFYFQKPAEPATGVLGVLLATNGFGLTMAPAIWALIIGIMKKQKFLLVTGIIGIVISIAVMGVMAYFFVKDAQNMNFSAQEIINPHVVSSEAKTGQNGITTKYPPNMKMTEDSVTVLRFEYVTSLFGTVSIDTTDSYEVARLTTTQQKSHIYQALVDVNHAEHHTMWANYIGRGQSHSIKAHDKTRSMLDVEYADYGQTYRMLIALKEINDELVIVSYAYPAYGSLNSKTFDDKQWRELVASVSLAEGAR